MTRLAIPEAALNQHIAVLGKTGSGKSTVMRGLMEWLLDHVQPACLIDPKGDWWGLKSSADGKHAGYPVVIFGGSHADVPINEHSGAHVAELVATGNRPCVIDLGGWMAGQRTRFFIAFAAALFVHTRGLRWLFIDEVHNFAPKGKIMDPDAGKMLHWANRLASEGRGKGLQLVVASQRPQKVHNDLLESCETLIALRSVHPRSREAIREWIDGCADPAKGAEVLASLAQMPRGTGWVWSPEIDFGPKKVAFPRFKTYDSFKPQAAGEHDKLKGWAEVDLDEVKAKLAVVVQEAEANDPKLLRAELARVRASLKDLESAPAFTPISRDDLKEAERRGYDRGRGDVLRPMRELVAEAKRNANMALGQVNVAIGRMDTLEQFLAHENEIQEFEPRPQSPMPRDSSARPPSPGRRESGPSGSGSNLPRAERLVLTAAAMFHPKACSRIQLSILSGYSVTSSTFANALGALRSNSYIDGSGDQNHATDKGLAALGAYERLPTGAHLVDFWLAKLGKAERSFLAYLWRVRPRAVAKEELAGETGYSISSSTFANALGKLRSLELINRGADIQLSEVFSS